MIENMKRHTLLLLALLAGSIFPAAAQSGMLLYSIADLPQRMQLNPAMRYFGDGAVAIPFLSSPYLSMSNAFAYSDFIRHSADDSLYMDPANMIGKLGDANYLHASAGTDLFGFGIRLGASYVGFGITERVDLQASYSKELMEFLWKGNAASLGTQALLDLGVGFTHRRDYALTYSLQLKSWAAGVRVKYLYGMENISVEQSRVTLLTNPNTFALTATSNIRINTSGIESNTFDEFAPGEYLFGRDNGGWGMDLGGRVFLNERWNVSASLLDLGSITWRSHTDNYISRNTDDEFTYSGIDVNAFFTEPSGASELFDHVLDTLEDAFEITHKQNAYSTGLPVQSYLGVTHVPDSANSFHLLAHTIRFDGKTYVDWSVSYVRRFGRWFAVSPGLTWINGRVNVGLGAVFSLNSYQFYVVSDNVYGMIYPTRSRTVDARAGVNFILGRK